ncbi:MAG: Spermine synthase, partial [Thermoleophilia bacterium]|nr:Spermine synthase [Thermoleophilia bacterium]
MVQDNRFQSAGFVAAVTVAAVTSHRFQARLGAEVCEGAPNGSQMSDIAHTHAEPRVAAPGWRLRYVVLASGSAAMSLQMSAVRLLAPWVGSSSLVWATIIGLSLLAMSSGYAVGGRVADRRATGPILARCLFAGAALIAAIPLVAPALLPHMSLGVHDAAASIIVGSTVGYLLLFLAPALLLGVTLPFAIRLTVPTIAMAGRTGGGLYALSTIGSIIGTLGSALVLLQFAGTRATLYTIAAVLLSAAFVAGRTRATALEPRAHPDTASQASLRLRRHGDDGRQVGAGARLAPATVLTIVVVEGMSLMATEMSIARLVAPYFGASQVVWAVLIAVVMGCIAAGSALGGRAVDRRPTIGALVVVLSFAAVAVALLPFAATPVMRLSTGAIDDAAIGTVVGAFIATMLVLITPIVLLSMVPVWVLRLTMPDVTQSGRTAGRLYAASTVGALIGTGAGALWLIPAIGTRRTLLVFALAISGAALLAALNPSSADARGQAAIFATPVVAIVLATVLLAAPTRLIKPIENGRVIAEHESQYQFIQIVVDSRHRHLLQLNEGWAVHSSYDPATILTGQYWDDFLPLPALLDHQAHSMLMIGNAAGTVPRGYRMVHPEIRVDGVELDPLVTAAGNRYFDMAGANLHVTEADGRPFLRAAGNARYDVILIDAYRQPYIPFYLATREFFALAKRHLTRGGVLAINIGSAPTDRRIDRAV